MAGRKSDYLVCRPREDIFFKKIINLSESGLLNSDFFRKIRPLEGCELPFWNMKPAL